VTNFFIFFSTHFFSGSVVFFVTIHFLFSVAFTSLSLPPVLLNPHPPNFKGVSPICLPTLLHCLCLHLVLPSLRNPPLNARNVSPSIVCQAFLPFVVGLLKVSTRRETCNRFPQTSLTPLQFISCLTLFAFRPLPSLLKGTFFATFWRVFGLGPKKVKNFLSPTCCHI
jgi:hypothetical protein